MIVRGIFILLVLLDFVSSQKETTSYNRLPGWGCNDFQDKNLGTTYSSPEECSDAAFLDPACTGNEIMWSPYSYAWGCRCCGPKPEGKSDEEAYKANNNWNTWQYTPLNTESPTTSPSAPPSASPSQSPTESPSSEPTFIHDWGLEKHASVAAVLPFESDTWPDNYPKDINNLIDDWGGSEYYIPNANPNVDIEMDLGREGIVTGVSVFTWYVTDIKDSIEVGIAPDNGGERMSPPVLPESGWEWYDLGAIPNGYNTEQSVIIPHVPARYVKIRLRGGTSSYSSRWGLRHLYVSGDLPPTEAPTGSPSSSPSKLPTPSPTISPSSSPTNGPSISPSKSPTTLPSRSPSTLPTQSPNKSWCICPMMNEEECLASTCSEPCTWTVSQACAYVNNDFTVQWHGFMELGQTHVIHATMENRHAPRLIADRETELLFTPTLTQQDTAAPSASPTETIDHRWGLEQPAYSTFDVRLLDPADTWPANYPSDKNRLVDESGSSEYYIPNSVPNIEIDFDLGAQRLLTGVYLKTWYVTKISESIEIGVAPDDGGNQDDPPTLPETGWTWFTLSAITSSYNVERTQIIPRIPSRYVKIRLLGGSSSYNEKWGLRDIKISGELDGVVDEDPGNNESGVINGAAFFPEANHEVRVSAFDASGALLGVMQARNPQSQRALLEQSLTEDDLGSYSDVAWSATLPWNWIKEGTTVLVGAENPEAPGNPLVHRLSLNGLAAFSEHTLLRTKVVIFGTPDDVDELDTFTHEADKLVNGMFGSMPVAELRWVDSEDWHLPYLVQGTPAGPQLVHSEAERRSVMGVTEANPSYEKEPGWDILKNQLTLKLANANSGRGLGLTTYSGGSPYSSFTWIGMGWAQSANNGDGTWGWDRMGYWEAWSAAAWVGWCGMRPGDECGNTLIHEIGHSQTMGHFTEGKASSWGIEDEYPQDGTNLETHPWGYDTVTRRFRTWYDHQDGSGKRDPMNGGEGRNAETCFPQYTAYHARKSQQWGENSPVLLSAATSNVPSDGSYLFNKNTKQYELLTDNFHDVVGEDAMPALQVGIPIISFVGTLGADDAVCQIYPGFRSSSGNTFEMPDPFTAGHTSVYNGGSYYVEVQFEDGSNELGIIAVPNLSGSTDLRYFSLNVAADRRPSSIRLYRFDTDSYPLATATSARTLLHHQAIELPDAAAPILEGLPAPHRSGRGWLGASGDITVKDLCISPSDCLAEAEVMKWRGDGSGITYTPSFASSGSTASGSIYDVPVTRKEDDSSHIMKVVVSRFYEEGGEAYPLDTIVPQGVVSHDASYGLQVYAPYELNSNLETGHYNSAENGLSVILGSSASGTLRISATYKLDTVTEIVDLNEGQFVSESAFTATESSAYFVAVDDSVGPTDRVWWGGSRTTLNVPLFSTCLGPHGFVVASLKAQQLVCGTSTWQMNAGRSSQPLCSHQVVLELDDASVNTWLNDPDLSGCALNTHAIKPIVLEAHGWHKEGHLGSVVLEFKLIV